MDDNAGQKYPQRWQTRFAFFDKHGAPKTKEYKAAFKKEKIPARFLIGFNILAFFFGFIYFFVLGLWRKNLSLLAATVGIGFLAGILELITGHKVSPVALNMVCALMWATTANYAYYLKETQNSKSWNPFEGTF
ncbi:DUF2628 domain-containing protein [Affinibrenneria salicis]|uniref:DUF2628 domain-containing protein n=1 Tax=Affinibrenneria salicis TaxID=2590031 RepID=A0A5J5FVG5_9GAMM|nr:DUF2628 domain-containing protein [Affinibrenneria salicis]KAA8997643.1 DUF2628 domain-containing protein [Affinibrenneria salicis]